MRKLSRKYELEMPADVVFVGDEVGDNKFIIIQIVQIIQIYNTLF
jgi:hypothetical protein